MTKKFANPEPTGLTKEAVYQFAADVAVQLGHPETDIRSVVSKLGGKIEYKDFWNSLKGDSGSLRVESEGEFTIYLAQNTTETRDRFTIAHELGHYVLHFLWARKFGGLKIENLEASRYGSDRTEWEANWFAAAFLMPRKHFTEKWHEYKENIVLVADHFGVSAMAANTRAKGLGLIQQ